MSLGYSGSTENQTGIPLAPGSSTSLNAIIQPQSQLISIKLNDSNFLLWQQQWRYSRKPWEKSTSKRWKRRSEQLQRNGSSDHAPVSVHSSDSSNETVPLVVELPFDRDANSDPVVPTNVVFLLSLCFRKQECGRDKMSRNALSSSSIFTPIASSSEMMPLSVLK
ncbi:hypothetical protein DH2020_013330 [Rehmannia glutinosa]|uniref:Uncharacterized protein n=1 Tax=Rehmannia glutinosa TaxID=99300 RepID=A0ABR0X4H4_REHGL